MVKGAGNVRGRDNSVRPWEGALRPRKETAAEQGTRTVPPLRARVKLDF